MPLFIFMGLLVAAPFSGVLMTHDSPAINPPPHIQYQPPSIVLPEDSNE